MRQAHLVDRVAELHQHDPLENNNTCKLNILTLSLAELEHHRARPPSTL